MEKKIICVFGKPIKHSLSPIIHNYFGKKNNIVFSYKAINIINKKNFKKEWIKLLKTGGIGINITIPYKQYAIKLAHKISYRSKMAGSVNTLIINKTNHYIYGDTTDGVGLIRDFNRLQIQILNKRILLLGAGGAINSILQQLLDLGPNTIYLVNRTLLKCKEIINRFNVNNIIKFCSYDELKNTTSFDVIINGTSVSIKNDKILLYKNIFKKKYTIAYDLMYSKKMTNFLKFAKNNQAKIYDGLGMLIEQAAETYFLLNHIRPNTQNLHINLRNLLNNNDKKK
ncbi:Shikimate dehydrogenase [Candidatus Portiera aleyrodidarum]|uniref:Shikimate dehydrogenase (NADP(+)) n=1 Tax=Candidatus Portiera aleyrodidarum TV TaxID=1297582 RepID=A0A8D3XAU0_9GAMM|nr:shikimate dehydrogenase [Candidatus Portiera aleyrodidarum]AGI27191.1 shikimate 5-dehydrogenase [Candidatus Portiera aleyrodidarum TV]CEI59175.1 Shikimate dehydrogenase [Candidatus Portiera aleyrodidarum]